MVAFDGPLILDPIEWRLTLERREERARGEPAPRRWNDVVDMVAGSAVLPATPGNLFASGINFSWHLHSSTVRAAVLRRPLAYMCWGIGYHRGIRRLLGKIVLRAARVVFVNDAQTAEEVRELAGIAPQRLPYVVDTEFFTFDPGPKREDFLFCPGANDRDGEVLLALARRGFRVVWLNNHPELAVRYAGQDSNLTIVSRPSFCELRDYYRRCAAVVQPFLRDIHAAGQTTALEALASGSPVILGHGRTATLFAEDGLVDVVRGSDPEEWARVIQRALDRERSDPALAASRTELIAGRHAVDRVAEKLSEGLRRMWGTAHG